MIEKKFSKIRYSWPSLENFKMLMYLNTQTNKMISLNLLTLQETVGIKSRFLLAARLNSEHAFRGTIQNH